MEEQAKVIEEVKVEVVEEPKKKFFTKKKVLAIGGTILALGIGAVVLLTKKDKDHEAEGENIKEAFETTSDESTSESEVTE